MSLLLIALVAIGGLLSPGASERRSVSTTVVGSDSTLATQPMPQQARVPLWMFGAIALTCTAGSILVSRQLNRPPVPPRRMTKPRSRSVKRRLRPQATAQLALPPIATSPQVQHQPPTARRSPHPHAGQRLNQRPAPQPPHPAIPPALGQSASAPAPVERSVLPPLLKRPSTSAKSAPAQVVLPRPTVQASVSILPPDIRKPFDWQTTELADAVDLRKRRSLSSLL
ncbi:hypothetical protein ACN4EK_12310 [Pantanalinema rosaneae CENA516]|uniref:hypothetical protein n=1 Tax=Pantanalinema rosaneae TaxID=1620701 RepID=UPI003D6E6BF6